jgi:hypothetical protein
MAGEGVRESGRYFYPSWLESDEGVGRYFCPSWPGREEGRRYMFLPKLAGEGGMRC